MGCVYRQKKSPYWWIKWVGPDGRPEYESTRTTDHTEAKGILAQREAKMSQGVPVTAAIGRLTFKEAAADLVADFEINKRSSADEVERRIRLHLLPYFGSLRMAEIDTKLIRRFIKKRQGDLMIIRKAREGQPELTKAPSNGEINRELQHLKRTFNLAIEDGRLLYAPKVPMLKEPPARKGFLEPDQFRAVLPFLPAALQPVMRFAYLSAWRIDSEVLPLEWSHVNFKRGEVWLDEDQTKNGIARVLPMNADLRALLEARQLERDQLKERGVMTPLVFFRVVQERTGQPKAKPIVSLIKAWKRACLLAGFGARIPHDLRRSAIRNMVAAGIGESTAMALSGHQTASVFRRYNIVSPANLRDATDRLVGLAGSTEVIPEVRIGRIVGSARRQTSENIRKVGGAARI